MRLAALLAIALSWAAAGTASARAEKTLAYEREAVWSTVVRFVRVDERLKITEKDAEAGYVLFELREENKTFRGSLEIATILKDGRSYTRFVVTVESRPEYVETGMLTRLEHKLRVELGSPAPAPTPKPKQDEKPKEPEKPKAEEPPAQDPDAPHLVPNP